MYNDVKFQLKGIQLGRQSRIKQFVVIYDAEHLTIGCNTVIGEFVHIWAGGGCFIGNDVLIAAHTMITTEGHATNAFSTGKKYNETSLSRPIIINDNVWVGGNCTILPGVSIGKNSIVGAGSVVTKDIPENQIWAGNPAKFIKAIK